MARNGNHSLKRRLTYSLKRAVVHVQRSPEMRASPRRPRRIICVAAREGGRESRGKLGRVSCPCVPLDDHLLTALASF